VSELFDALCKVTDVVCHDNCSDGTMSAIFLKDALPKIRVHFCQHGTAREKLQVGPNMLFCDFAPPESRHREFIDAGAIILDHHMSEKHITEAAGPLGVFGDEKLDPGVSGAVLAYRHVWLPIKERALEARLTQQPGAWQSDLNDIRRGLYEAERERAENFARLIGIRDTWQKHDSDWLKGCELAESIRFFPQESWLIPDPFAQDREPWWKPRLAVGQRLVEKQLTTLRKVLEGAYRFVSESGTRVVMFSGTKFTSDACEMVKDAADLIVGFDFFAIEDGQATLGFSTRSFTSFDCAAFCRSLGGGGHSKAAGFSVRFSPVVGTQDPFSLLQARLGEYEAAAGVQ
jgi:hypothetical protein